MQNNAQYKDFLELNEKQKAFIRIKVEEGLTQREIAKRIDINETTIGRWKKDEKFMAGLRGYTVNGLDEIAPQAMRRMAQLMYSKSELVSFQAAKDILDRTGYVPVDKKEIELTGGVQFVDSIPKED